MRRALSSTRSSSPASTEKAAAILWELAILRELANLTSLAPRISYAVADNVKDPVTK